MFTISYDETSKNFLVASHELLKKSQAPIIIDLISQSKKDTSNVLTFQNFSSSNCTKMVVRLNPTQVVNFKREFPCVKVIVSNNCTAKPLHKHDACSQ